MELLNRYLQAVRFWLPRQQRNDIIRELSEDLRSQFEDKEAELGRPLDEADTAEILKKSGHPMLVGTRFRTDQDVPALPLLQLYKVVLKTGLLWVVAPILAITNIPMIVMSANPALAILKAWTNIWMSIVFAVGTITVGFLAFQWLNPGAKLFQNWDSRRLPPTRDPNRIPRFGSVLEVLFGLGFLAWWNPSMVIVDLAKASKYQLGIPTTWLRVHGDFYWPITLLVVGGIILSGYNFLQPLWSKSRLGVKAAMDGATAIILMASVALEVPVMQAQWQIIHATASYSKPQIGTAGFNLGVATTLVVIGLSILVSCVVYVVKAVNFDGDNPITPSHVAETTSLTATPS
jgi:hypothetical protein